MLLLSTGLESYQDMFSKHLNFLSTYLAQDDKWHYTSQSKKSRQKSVSFLGPKLWSKINPSTKNIKTMASLIHAVKKNISLHLKT